MRVMATVFIALCALNSVARDQEKQNEIGGNLGWGNPSGFGIYYARNIESNHQIGLGAGFSGSGGRLALDYKYLFAEDEDFNPYMGFAFSHATGVSEMRVNVNADTALYDVNGGNAFQPRAGFRYCTGSLGLYLNVGYGIVLNGGGVEYLEGSERESVKDFAEMVGLGGFEISGTGTFFF